MLGNSADDLSLHTIAVASRSAFPRARKTEKGATRIEVRKGKMAEEMENVDLSTDPVPPTPSATTMPIVEPVVKNGSAATGFIPLVTVVGFHHAR